MWIVEAESTSQVYIFYNEIMARFYLNTINVFETLMNMQKKLFEILLSNLNSFIFANI